ncbi:putative hydrolase [Saitoella complicata NRRL Y-17804]|uniref:AB hydrolase-1 domain-containing protein n=1 Tax=Saitoella complicata (strain BCRC 22490 / CBS 7301 / JCM 7358 / NBRC 10748 / NRRL Y-17804) TaxID=698492 RepID=A0A0E9NML4_SAICN|nr:putative hydrolase [Saitoella complicata NRRL Y-17804]ODQ50373.1 putative hydrolase [Saitoella complicata NRRL Y-17804]GAO51122.1 hypothetical protein G7K_5233-t1 [Saitoella complicata NRRL Y-17804]
MEILNHQGEPVTHSRALLPGPTKLRLHYYTTSTSPSSSDKPALLLLHGVPKTSYYWRKVIPLLSHKYRIICPDMRGLGDSSHPASGYDMGTVARDFADLMTELGIEKFHLVGEDWGAAAAYALAAQCPNRVKSLVFQEMVLPGYGLESWSAFTKVHVNSGTWLWHVGFYAVPDVPELLITGHEREYFSSFIKNEAWNPSAITPDAINEYVRCYSNPGGLRSMLSIYRATLETGDQNREFSKNKLKMPVLAIGSKHFIGEEVKRQMEYVSEKVEYKELPWGHQLAEECPEELAGVYLEWLEGKK